MNTNKQLTNNKQLMKTNKQQTNKPIKNYQKINKKHIGK